MAKNVLLFGLSQFFGMALMMSVGFMFSKGIAFSNLLNFFILVIFLTLGCASYYSYSYFIQKYHEAGDD